MNGIVFNSDWAETHPTDAQLLADELLYEALEAEAAARTCNCCWYFADVDHMEPFYGICSLHSEPSDLYFKVVHGADGCYEWQDIDG